MVWLKSFILFQWERKLAALLIAILIWVLVNQSITDTRTIPNVPIRVINLPEDKVIPNMQPNGIIGKRISLTLTGSKVLIKELEPGDLEVLLDASEVQQNDWIVQINKKNLVSLNPALDLTNHISDVKHPEFVLKFTKIIQGKVPVRIMPPIGTPPPGYVFLDIWPQQLFHTIVGPQDQVEELLKEGITIEFDLNEISKSELDKIGSSRENFHDDEVSFFIPSSWKKLSLPLKGGSQEEINDPESQTLHIDFLRKEYLPFKKGIPISVYYPLRTAASLNPEKAPLIVEGKIKQEEGIHFLSTSLFAYGVSPLFFEIIENHLQLVVVADAHNPDSPLAWNLQVINPYALEEVYLKELITSRLPPASKSDARHTKKREAHLRLRFREFLQHFTLYTAPDKRLQIDARIQPLGISVIPSG